MMIADVVERHLGADIRQIVRAMGNDRRGVVYLSNSGTDYARVVIDLDATTVRINQTAAKLTTTVCNYGGVRWWVCCPGCGERRAVLHYKALDHGGVWLCRTCLNLHYRSQQATKTDCWTWYHKAEAIARQIDPTFRITDGFEAAYADWWLFPDRPKGIHEATYLRMRNKFVRYLQHGGQELLSGYARVMGH